MMTKAMMSMAGALVSVALAGKARAQLEPVDPVDPYPDAAAPLPPIGAPPLDPGPGMIPEQGIYTPGPTLRPSVGIALQVGGGVVNFVSEGARDVTDVGGAWDVRLTFGTRGYAAFEMAYAGAVHDAGGAGLDDDAYLVRHGFEGALRLNAPIPTRTWFLAPFALGGLGWSRYDVMSSNAPPTAVLRDHDAFLTVPLGFGLAAAYRGMMLDARFTYRAAFDDELFANGAGQNTWTAGAHIGREF